MTFTRTCEDCGELFEAAGKYAKYCPKCRSERQRQAQLISKDKRLANSAEKKKIWAERVPARTIELSDEEYIAAKEEMHELDTMQREVYAALRATKKKKTAPTKKQCAVENIDSVVERILGIAPEVKEKLMNNKFPMQAEEDHAVKEIFPSDSADAAGQVRTEPEDEAQNVKDDESEVTPAAEAKPVDNAITGGIPSELIDLAELGLMLAKKYERPYPDVYEAAKLLCGGLIRAHQAREIWGKAQ